MNIVAANSAEARGGDGIVVDTDTGKHATHDVVRDSCIEFIAQTDGIAEVENTNVLEEIVGDGVPGGEQLVKGGRRIGIGIAEVPDSCPLNDVILHSQIVDRCARHGTTIGDGI